MRKQNSRQFWEKHIKAYLESNMNQAAYCQANGLNYRTLQNHLYNERKRKSENQHSIEKQSEWLPITVIKEPENISPGGIRLHINKIIIEAESGFDVTNLANMLQAVGAVC